MLRFIGALAALTIIASPAAAAQTNFKSSTAKTAERGVTVWRGKAPEKPAEAAALSGAKAASCEKREIVVAIDGYPPRRLRTHGFWSGRAPHRLSFGVPSTGFYADRVAAGH